MTDRRRYGSCRRATLLALMLLGGVAMTPRPAAAGAEVAIAAATAGSGLGACASSAGKALYDCVANVLDRMGNELGRSHPEVTRSLHTAAAGVRSGVKAQALSAIAQCRSAIAAAMRQAKALASGFLEGWGGSGLSAIVGVLARASQLIQSKG
jgi:hypothetical protein